MLVAILLTLLPAFDWAVLNATWVGTVQDCRENGGACWAFIAQKYNLILFGLYPLELYWRPVTVLVIFALMFAACLTRGLWGRPVVLIWAGGLVLTVWLMRGGFGLTPVPTSMWGGLPVSLFLATVGLTLGYPLAVLFALMRQSELQVLRVISGTLVELVRGVPLIAVLFISVMVVPLFLPVGIQINKFACAQVGLIVFAGAYMSEIIRVGMQVIDKGQFEASHSLGLGYMTTQAEIVLPQVNRTITPALVTTAIGFFQDTTLVIVIGVFDLLNAARAATTDPAWIGLYVEAFLFVGAIYFVISALISMIGKRVEIHFAQAG
ncbi:MAG: amino acid ABC transporter permease [Sphingomonadaceae bacterium]